MKRFVTAIGICALFLAPQVVSAQSHKWADSTTPFDDAWDNAFNWNDSTGDWPDNAADTVLIAKADSNPVDYPGAASQTVTISTLDINAATNNATVQLDVNSDTLTISGNATLTGNTSADNTATIKLAGGTLDFADLFMYGGNSSSRRAILDYDSGTMSAITSVTVRDYVKFDVNNDNAESVLALSLPGISVDATSTFLEIVHGADDTIAASSLDIDAEADSAARSLEITGDTLTVSGNATLTGGDAASNTATLKLNDADATLDLADLFINGGDSSAREAILWLADGTLDTVTSVTMKQYSRVRAYENMTVSGDLDVDSDAAAATAVIDFGTSNVTVTVDDLIVGGTNAASLEFTKTSGTGSLVTD